MIHLVPSRFLSLARSSGRRLHHVAALSTYIEGSSARCRYAHRDTPLSRLYDSSYTSLTQLARMTLSQSGIEVVTEANQIVQGTLTP